ncbi:MAG: hypothetical protein EBS59_00030 [Verrucomicrobia bacterium]|nr:hypothetical protein [Verrucomicrobiota bacterium]
MALAVFIPKGIGQEKKGKENLVFGKLQDLEISLVPVPDAVGSGGKPAVMLADGKASQDSRWLRIDVPFQTKKKITPELKIRDFEWGGCLSRHSQGGQTFCRGIPAPCLSGPIQRNETQR